MPLIEIGIPPTFEVEDADLDAWVHRAASAVQRFAVEPGKLTLYLSALLPGEPLVVDFRLRALRRAHVVAPSSTAYLYYEPEVRMETAPARLEAH